MMNPKLKNTLLKEVSQALETAYQAGFKDALSNPTPVTTEHFCAYKQADIGNRSIYEVEHNDDLYRVVIWYDGSNAVDFLVEDLNSPNQVPSSLAKEIVSFVVELTSPCTDLF